MEVKKDGGSSSSGAKSDKTRMKEGGGKEYSRREWVIMPTRRKKRARIGWEYS